MKSLKDILTEKPFEFFESSNGKKYVVTYDEFLDFLTYKNIGYMYLENGAGFTFPIDNTKYH